MIKIEKVTKRKTGYISINYVEDGEYKCLIASPAEILAWYAVQQGVKRTLHPSFSDAQAEHSVQLTGLTRSAKKVTEDGFDCETVNLSEPPRN